MDEAMYVKMLLPEICKVWTVLFFVMVVSLNKL